LHSASTCLTRAALSTCERATSKFLSVDAQGNSAYPRIFDTPGYRLFFRFDAQGTNGFDFATYSTPNNGDWFSGTDTIRTGAWYHVAASYDRSNFANLPALYVNGIRRSPTTITSPSATPPRYTGTGYIGNTSGLTRAWKGGLDDLRIYNRSLTDAEIAALAALPPTNVAPSVNAGTSQTVIWPATASLSGSVSDDGKPNPPGVVSLAWTQTSGPAGVLFANSNALFTTASFPAPSVYGLELVGDDGQVQTASQLTIAAVPQTLLWQLRPRALQLSWATNSANWRLQAQTNPLTRGLGTIWADVPGPVTNPFVVPLDPSAGSVFHRLILSYP